jgi:hypothetical protein
MIGFVRRIRGLIRHERGRRRLSWVDAVTPFDLAEMPDDERHEMVQRIRVEMAYKWPHLYAPDGTWRGPRATS